MFSPRALRYLIGLERRPFVEDIGLVVVALEMQGMPANASLIDFHRLLAGYVVRRGTDPTVYGIMQPDPGWYGPLRRDAHQELMARGQGCGTASDGSRV